MVEAIFTCSVLQGLADMVVEPRLWIHACRIGLASPTWVQFYLGPI